MQANQAEMYREGLYDSCIMTKPENEMHDCTISGASKIENALMLGKVDCPQIASYNVLHLFSEVAEVLQADKRWKSIRKGYVRLDEKREELADCFICLFNIAIWSGVTSQEMLHEIVAKSAIYSERIADEVAKGTS